MLALGIGGSTRTGSRSLAALELVMRYLRNHCDTETVDVGQIPVGPFTAGRNLPDTVPFRRFELLVSQAAIVVVSSPVYQESMSGALKNLLDYIHEFDHTPVGFLGRVAAVIAVAEGSSVAGCLNAVSDTLRGMGADVVPTRVGLSATAFDETGQILDPIGVARLAILADDLWTRAANRRTETDHGGL